MKKSLLHLLFSPVFCLTLIRTGREVVLRPVGAARIVALICQRLPAHLLMVHHLVDLLKLAVIPVLVWRPSGVYDMMRQQRSI